MSFIFPKAGTKAHGLVAGAHTITALQNWRKLPTRTEAAASAKRFCQTTRSGATGVYTMALLANDTIALCFFGKRGGFKEIWNFGRA